jgi:hypothetical protein
MNSEDKTLRVSSSVLKLAEAAGLLQMLMLFVYVLHSPPAPQPDPTLRFSASPPIFAVDNIP